MTSAKNYALVALALTTLAGTGLAWRQYRELVELRAAAMNTDERAEWQRRAWDLEKLNRELQDDLAAVRAATDDDPVNLMTDAAEPHAADERSRGGFAARGRGPQQQLGAVRELMNKPEVQALVRVQQQAAIDARYAALFHRLNLPPEQLDKLKTLLADRQTTVQDVLMAAREQGINPRSDPDGFRQLIANAQNDINNAIKSIVGENGFAQLQTYEQTLPQRNVVNELQQRLTYSNSPLTPTQADQLVQILAANSPQRSGGQARGGFNAIGDLGIAAGLVGPGAMFNVADGRGATAPVTPAAVNQAHSVLSATQVSALQQIQQQQQSQQQLQRFMRETMAPIRRGGTPASDGAGAAAGQNRRSGGG